MTTADPPPDDLDSDELAVHAVLDGEATVEERRRVARDPRLRARVEAMRAVADVVGEEPEAPGDAVLARLRATALASLDEPAEGRPTGDRDAEEPDEGADAPSDPSPVTSLTPRRTRRSLPPLPAVAAVVLVLLLVGIGLIASSRSGDESSADATSSAVDSGPSGDQSGGGPSSTGDASDSEAAAPESDRGSTGSQEAPVPAFADDDALRLALQTVDPLTLALDPGAASDGAPAPEADALDPETAVDRCATVLQATDAAIGEVQASALVDVDGTLLLVLSTPVAATERGPASTRLTVLEAESCVPRFGVQRDP